jgi:D-glycero-D-manno-heptose 1,7-bisphosphate phosphatase
MKKAFFLDRDGVVNEDYKYVYKKENFRFKYGIFSLLEKAIDLNYIIIIITNQSGIARKLYSKEDFNNLMKWVTNKFSERGIKISKVFYCPHHPTSGFGVLKQDCQCRKPNPLLFLKAKNEFKVDMSQSLMIGDKISDIDAARKAGVKNLFLISKMAHSNQNDYHTFRSILHLDKNIQKILEKNC